ncbi:NAD(P)-dependent oxidoreductase [Kiritimatiellota bacterium B12222]|nr:NAD(P)-dependent oxidoreductase [Kiritimatiellota bacterium B12222]
MDTKNISPEHITIGFIGLGVMGQGMAGHLLAAGYRLNLFTRSKAKAEALIAERGRWCDNVKDLAEGSDVIFTIVGFPQDVESLYLGEAGLIAYVKAGTVLVDMTTSCPDLAQRISQAVALKGGEALDAPVSGGDVGAREGRLSIMVGGNKECVDRMMPLFELMGTTIVYQGPAGAGQHCKMCNQIAIASTMIGVCESMAYAQKAGLDVKTVLKSIESGAAGSWSLSHLAPRMIEGDFDPGFYVKHFIKDMTIAQATAESMALETPGLDLAKRMYETLAANGGEDEGTQALFKGYTT